MLTDTKAYRRALLLAGVLLIAGIVRLPQIYGDPPAADISRSGDFLADEGTHSHNALEWILTGNWYIPDSFNPAVNTPIFTLFQYLVMRLFGVGLDTVRYGAVFCGVIAILLLYSLLRRHDATAAGVAALLGAANFPLIVYNRLAFMENLLLCFLLIDGMLLSMYLDSPQRRPLLFAFCAVFVVGYLTKASIVFFAIVFFLLVWQQGPMARKQTFVLSAVCIIMLVTPLWIFWIHPYLGDWQHYQQLTMAPKIALSPLTITKNYARYIVHIKLFEFMPVTYVIALMMGLRGLWNMVHKKDEAAIPRMLYLWFWTGLLFLGFVSSSPPRYSLVLMPAILGLNGLFFAELFKPQKMSEARKWPRYSFLIMSFIIFLQVAFGFYRLFVYRQVFLSCFLPVVGLLALYAIWRTTHDERAGGLAAWGLLMMIFIVQGVQIVRFHTTMQYSLYKAMLGVADILQQEKSSQKIVLAGDSAMLVAFEVHVPTVDIMYRQDRLPLLVKRMRPNYLFLEDPTELTRLQKQMPAYWQHVTVLGRYPIMNNYTHGMDATLYRVEGTD